MSGKQSIRIQDGLGALLLFALVLVLLPLFAVILILWLLTSVVLYVLVWLLWCARGKNILFVYSDSPVWHDFIEQTIVPRIQARSVILNWSDRRHWIRKVSLQSLLFRHFGGYREYNPLALYFRPFRLHRTFRFWKPFRDWKHGKPESLKRVEEDFFRAIGIADQIQNDESRRL